MKRFERRLRTLEKAVHGDVGALSDLSDDDLDRVIGAYVKRIYGLDLEDHELTRFQELVLPLTKRPRGSELSRLSDEELNRRLAAAVTRWLNSSSPRAIEIRQKLAWRAEETDCRGENDSTRGDRETSRCDRPAERLCS